MSRRATFHLVRAVAQIDPDGKRRCAYCGDFIDPIGYCGYCQGVYDQGAPCAIHKRPRLRADAAFCNKVCRAAHRDSWARDCHPLTER